jgi:hypothetical protein
MCLYPKLVRNPRYKSNKKNGGIIPPLLDERVKMVPIGCQRCIECRKQRRMEWVSRLMYEHRNSKMRGHWCTFTYSPVEWCKLRDSVYEDNGGEELHFYDLQNKITAKAIKLWRERCRKGLGESPRFWIVPELGSENTKRLHAHGFVWTNNRMVFDKWNFGFFTVKPLIEDKIKYCTKYIFKVHPHYKGFIPKVFCSNGIGKGYENSVNAQNNAYNGEDTDTRFRTTSGHFIGLPKYYRNMLYDDDTKEKLWLHLLDKRERWVLGVKADLDKEGWGYYFDLLKWGRSVNKELGYGSDEEWDDTEYQEQLNALWSS